MKFVHRVCLQPLCLIIVIMVPSDFWDFLKAIVWKHEIVFINWKKRPMCFLKVILLGYLFMVLERIWQPVEQVLFAAYE